MTRLKPVLTLLPAILFAGMTLAGFAAPAAAQPTSAQQAAIRASCQGDFRANCAGVSPGSSAALQCLQTNLAKLTPACQSAVTAATTPAPAAAAPAAPAAAPAATAEPAAPAKPAATAKPAPAAAAAPPPPALTPRQELMLVRQSCSRDFRTYCSNVPLGAGNGVACLRANAASLSGGCKKALAAAAR